MTLNRRSAARRLEEVAINLKPSARLAKLLYPSVDFLEFDPIERELVERCNEFNTVIEKRKRQLSRDVRIARGQRSASDIRSAYRRAYVLDMFKQAVGELLTMGCDLLDRRHSVPDSDADVLERFLFGLLRQAVEGGLEVHCLLSGGFPNGAMACCRKLHEIAMTAITIVDGPNVDYRARARAARCYVEYSAVVSYRMAVRMKEDHDQLFSGTFDEKWLEGLKEVRDEFVDLYGEEAARSDYGWACGIVGNSRPTLPHLEQAAGLSHLRTLYYPQNNNVHANGKSWFESFDRTSSREGGNAIQHFMLPIHTASISMRLILWSFIFCQDRRKSNLLEYFSGIVVHDLLARCEAACSRANRSANQSRSK